MQSGVSFTHNAVRGVVITRLGRAGVLAKTNPTDP